jgi:hypothetical protein
MHLKFSRLRSDKIRENAIKKYNEKVENYIKLKNCNKEDIDQLTNNILVEEAILYAQRMHSLEQNRIRQEVKKVRGKGKIPDYTPGTTEKIVKVKYTLKSGETKEYETLVKKERKGSKFHREYKERAKEIYEYYKPGGIGTDPISSTNDAAKHFSMTNYMFNKIINAYELELMAGINNSKSSESSPNHSLMTS